MVCDTTIIKCPYSWNWPASPRSYPRCSANDSCFASSRSRSNSVSSSGSLLPLLCDPDRGKGGGSRRGGGGGGLFDGVVGGFLDELGEAPPSFDLSGSLRSVSASSSMTFSAKSLYFRCRSFVPGFAELNFLIIPDRWDSVLFLTASMPSDIRVMRSCCSCLRPIGDCMPFQAPWNGCTSTPTIPAAGRIVTLTTSHELGSATYPKWQKKFQLTASGRTLYSSYKTLCKRSEQPTNEKKTTVTYFFLGALHWFTNQPRNTIIVSVEQSLNKIMSIITRR